MTTESPLFQSSMELLGHSITHFNGSEELDRKLLILHLANSIELILKDMLLDTGESIYKNPKETVTISHCIEALKSKNIQIPFLNKIELLIDERNALQHRFGSPNELTSIFYMNISMNFFKEILTNHYEIDLDEILDQFADKTDLHAYRMRVPSSDSELNNLRKLAKIHPLGALLSAMSFLEGKVIELANKIGLEEEIRMRPPWVFISTNFLSKIGVDSSDEIESEMNDVRQLRNKAAHGRMNPTLKEVDNAITTIEKYDKIISTIDIEKAKIKAMEFISISGLSRRGINLRKIAQQGDAPEPATNAFPTSQPSIPPAR